MKYGLANQMVKTNTILYESTATDAYFFNQTFDINRDKAFWKTNIVKFPGKFFVDKSYQNSAYHISDENSLARNIPSE
ncbi:hypothetical protein E2K98_04970 [Bacillus salipaludis]|uniref:Uncharacterized protein n=1 Tax=Bacillus salipaludis TaxID=2547811 RepID=A0A4R5VY99_9BACI|nr:hypothetical protein [Bacillus salipaludis]MDQ6594904.1 hypothetical protein [Bacillus salipaludis]TDK64213.1 hypothetical protein E2K98_04970 [Bacillus salipaludis]